jgi:flagellum-specific peptidoglycan hydrolase FlgJ
VYAQAQLETNGFTSRIFKENNNLFGMKQAMQRSSTNIGEQHGHAFYESWRQSVLDYALYQCKYLSGINSKDEYLQYLKQNYAEDPNYFNKLTKLLKK